MGIVIGAGVDMSTWCFGLSNMKEVRTSSGDQVDLYSDIIVAVEYPSVAIVYPSTTGHVHVLLQ